MKPERLPATPDLMALCCLIGGAVREAGARDLLVQLLLLSGYCPPLAHALRIWIAAESAYATSEFEYAIHCEEDGEGGCDEIRRGWESREGPVLLWRHVDRFGRALLIPVQWAWMVRTMPRQMPTVIWTPVERLVLVSDDKIFWLGSTAPHSGVLFVTISK